MKSSPLGFIKTKLSQLEKDIIFEKKDTTVLENYFTKDESYTQQQFLEELEKYQPVGSYAEKSSVPTKISELVVNDANFVDATVDNLQNYYLKDQTMNREQFKTAVDSVLAGLSVTLVNSVDEIDLQNEKTIYLVPNNKGTNDAYDEYIVIQGKKELIGKTNIDLSIYAKKSEVDALGYATDTDIKPVAKSGEYKDLTDKPVIPNNVSDLTDADDLLTKHDLEIATRHRGNKKLKRLTNQTLNANSWSEDLEAPMKTEYPYKYELTVDGINGTDWKVTDFYIQSNLQDKLCPIVETADGKVYFWASVNLDTDIIIETLDIVAVAHKADIIQSQHEKLSTQTNEKLSKMTHRQIKNLK